MGDIFEYIAVVLAAPSAASNLVLQLYDFMRLLSAQDNYLARQGFRTLIVDNYIVFYVADETIAELYAVIQKED